MSFSLAVWITVCLANAVAFVATFKRGVDRGLLWLRWYFALAIAGNLCTHFTLVEYGFRSKQYVYAYYLADLAIVVLGYFVLSRLVELAFERSSLKLQGLRTGSILLFTGLAACSAYFVYAMRGHLSAPFIGMEMEQNFSFLGMLLAIVLFIGMNLMQVQGIRFRRVVLAFSLLYSSGAIAYSLAAVLPAVGLMIGVYIVPVTSLAGVGLIAYSLWVPEPERRSRPVRADLAFREARGTSW
ncbi:MAG: hypothetical protein ACRD1L_01430 [Terriglobales bacterium]